jgi:oligoendopeptidase F
VRLDQSAYEKYRQSPNRADRKLVFDSFWGAWKAYESTDGAILTAGVMGNVFTAKARKYGNALAAALFPDNMPESVYRMLVAQANAGLPTLHRYFRLRKQLLGIKDELHYYDIYPTMFPGRNIPKFTIAESERLSLEALSPYGAEYLSLLKKGFAGKWTEPYPRPHKASGAYMNGSAYDVHPYLLLNHNDDYSALSTFAHEWGHAVHTLLSVKNQPFEKANYSTFTAESASIANEMLLNDYMVAHAKTKEEKLYYLGEGLESIRGTFFRQVMFAEFELAIHEEIENGRPLSGARMTEIYCGLLKRYHGEAQGVMTIDPAYCIEWAFVPHFFYNFYVYQYATSMAGAAQFTDAIVKEGRPAAERFLDMLRAGGADYPYELYKRAGIDMASEAPYKALVARMNRIMDEIEALRR